MSTARSARDHYNYSSLYNYANIHRLPFCSLCFLLPYNYYEWIISNNKTLTAWICNRDVTPTLGASLKPESLSDSQRIPSSCCVQRLIILFNLSVFQAVAHFLKDFYNSVESSTLQVHHNYHSSTNGLAERFVQTFKNSQWEWWEKFEYPNWKLPC